MRTTDLWPALALAACLALPRAAYADNPPAMDPALAKLATMVTNLGYTTTNAADNSHFRIDYQGSNGDDYTIDFEMSSDDTLVYTYAYLQTYDAAQMAKLPFQKILEFQNNGNVYFSMQNSSSGEDFYANSVFGNAGLTPADLRSEVEYLVKRIDLSQSLWDPKQWK